MALREFIQRCLDQNHRSLLRSIEGLTAKELSWRPGPECMSIGFIVWHCGRAQDFLVQTLIEERQQVWEQGWAEKFNRAPARPRDTGFGFKRKELEAFQVPSASVLLGYVEATRAQAHEHLQGVEDSTLEKVTVRNNPYGVRLTLASVYQQLIWEQNQHGGQIAYLRGMQRGIEDPAFTGGVLDAVRV